MDLTPTPRSRELGARLLEFMDELVYPAETIYWQQRASGDPHRPPPVLEELKGEARSRGLWNLFLPNEESGPGLSNLEYAPLAEITGRSPHIAPEAINCSAPDTGNMEVLAQFGSDEQRERWLGPLLEGTIRSCFAMTEPGVASSDPTNLATRIRRDGDSYVVSGRKWWSTGALDPRCRVAIVMGVTDPDADRHARHSMILVPLDTPGVNVVRDLTTFGYTDRQGHGELVFDDVRVPAANLIGAEGAGFAIAQARLGPGRIHHSMRAIGTAERSLELMVERASSRQTFGVPLTDHGVISTWIAESRLELEQARLLTLKTAWLMDTVGNKLARTEIAAIKVVAARVGTRITDRAIQVFGAAGLSADTPLAYFYAMARQLRIVDGPDEVHLRTIAREEIRRIRNGLRGSGGSRTLASAL